MDLSYSTVDALDERIPFHSSEKRGSVIVYLHTKRNTQQTPNKQSPAKACRASLLVLEIDKPRLEMRNNKKVQCLLTAVAANDVGPSKIIQRVPSTTQYLDFLASSYSMVRIWNKNSGARWVFGNQLLHLSLCSPTSISGFRRRVESFLRIQLSVRIDQLQKKTEKSVTTSRLELDFVSLHTKSRW